MCSIGIGSLCIVGFWFLFYCWLEYVCFSDFVVLYIILVYVVYWLLGWGFLLFVDGVLGYVYWLIFFDV